jgi:RNA-directed DNA polymerase
MIGVFVPEHAPMTPGVLGAARVQGDTRNTRGPSVPLTSERGALHKRNAKAVVAQRESEGVVVARISATNNVEGAKDPCGGNDGEAGKRERMGNAKVAPKHSDARKHVDKAQQLQRRLGMAAKESPGRRFHALFDLMSRSDVLDEAWKRVKKRKGAAGVDHETLAAIERQGVDAFLREIQTSLRHGTYRPKAVLRRYIPKADGKLRPLGIPTVRDRVAQAAARLVLEPIFEADFKDSSFGYRAGRSTTDALEALRLRGARGGNFVLDADITNFFGSISHDKLMKLVERRISDRRVLKLIRQWLKARVMDDGVETETISGTPQGGVISPLLSNIYLHYLDEVWAKKCSHLGLLVRYADDFVVMCETKAACDEAERRVRIIFERLELELHPAKTRKVDLTRGREGFDFLGCHLRKRMSGPIWERERREVYFLQRWPSAKKMKQVRQRVHELTGRHRNGVKDVRVLIKDLNDVLRGWGNHFGTGNANQKFVQLDRYVVERLRNFMARRKGRNLRPGEVSAWTRAFFEGHGLYRLRGTIRYPGQRKLLSESPSVSRVPEIGTHGLKGGLTSTPTTSNSKGKG